MNQIIPVQVVVNNHPYNRYTYITDLAAAIFLAVIGAAAVRLICFECVVLGVIEFCLAIIMGIVALVRNPFLEREFHFFYTYFGKAVFLLLFGVLGLSADLIRYVFSVLTIMVGFLYLAMSCCKQTPVQPCKAFTGGSLFKSSSDPVSAQPNVNYVAVERNNALSVAVAVDLKPPPAASTAQPVPIASTSQPLAAASSQPVAVASPAPANAPAYQVPVEQPAVATAEVRVVSPLFQVVPTAVN